MADNEWTAHAGWWQEEFTQGRDVEYVEQILPLIAQRLPLRGHVLDIGAGEGQVARMAAAAGLTATAVELVDAQVRVGAERDAETPPTQRVRWVRSSALALPLAEARFDAAVMCLVLEHLVDLDLAVAEVARVLRPGGRFLLLLNHPLLATPGSGWIDDHILEEQYWRVGDYLPEAETVEEVFRDVFVTFHHRPLGRYVNAMADVGLVVRHLVEPPPAMGDAEHIPRLLLLDLEREGRR